MSPFLGEFLGTLMLILLGDGVVATVLLSKSKGQNSGWIVITAGWAFAVTIGVFVAQAFGSPDAHLNPAVTLAFACLTGDFGKLPVYVPAQFLGAFCGAVLVWLHHLPLWKETSDPGFKLGI
ncbi:MAG TPA: aquaporin, partial [Candidatus Methylacidiphilales bacterium]